MFKSFQKIYIENFFLKMERTKGGFFPPGAKIVRAVFQESKINKQLTDFYIKNRLIIDYSRFTKSARAC